MSDARDFPCCNINKIGVPVSLAYKEKPANSGDDGTGRQPTLLQVLQILRWMDRSLFIFQYSRVIFNKPNSSAILVVSHSAGHA